MGRAPIEDGGVIVQEDQIVEVAPFQTLSPPATAQLIDLGESILLPGLINCHCHLDYTGMAGMIPPRKSFSDWIKSIIAIKATWSYTEFAQSWVKGAHMLEDSGVTTVIDIEAVPELLPDAWLSTPLRVFSCLELINIRSAHQPDHLVREAVAKAHQAEGNSPNRCGLSPHAPYSTTTALRSQARTAADEESRLLTTHVAESAEEASLYRDGKGALYDWLRAQSDLEHSGEGSPVTVLEKTGYLEGGLIVAHANETDETDAANLAKNACHVVHCPRSHEFFNHRAFPWKLLEQAGVNLTLGTDSLASVPSSSDTPLTLDLFAEMKCLAEKPGAPSPNQIVAWATVNGAKAIGMPTQLGQLESGFLADMIAIPYFGPLNQAYEAVTQHRGSVSHSMILGKWIKSPSLDSLPKRPPSLQPFKSNIAPT